MIILSNGGFLYIMDYGETIVGGTLCRLDMFGIRNVISPKSDAITELEL